MKRKVHYYLHSGKISSMEKSMIYAFSNTIDIKICISRKGFSLEVDRTVKKEASALVRDPLFRDAIKKATLIQLIKYGKISGEDVYVTIDDVDFCIYDRCKKTPERLIYSLCGTQLQRPMVGNWTEASLQRILDVTKSKTDRLDAALDALLLAKSKLYETERFVYLWMALNGLYGFAAETAAGYMPGENEKSWIKKEYAQIKFYSMILDYPYCQPKEDKEKVLKSLELILARINPAETDLTIKAIKNHDTDNFYVREISAIFSEIGISEGEMHPYTVLLLYMPYQIRCKYFHGEHTVPLLCFENEHPLPVLRILNNLMEEYLDISIPQWFDGHFYTTDIIPRIRLLAENCKCTNKGKLETCIISGEEKA
ncbi:MAG: hypothetical protein IK115_00315 [Lachnospiraceae bacterium]|nr:hypothetical protein [Lachnospiraceae bacterium]